MNVDVLDESGASSDVTRLVRLCRFVMRRMRLHPATELCVRLVDTGTITTLNEQWMDGDGPTDVLSFPMDELRPGAGDDVQPDDEPGYLGDIALCPQIAERQAPSAGHSPTDEIDLLIVHGILHLLGFDHAEPDEHAHMFGLQGRLLVEWHQVLAGKDPE